jgi:hypothetical protein
VIGKEAVGQEVRERKREKWRGAEVRSSRERGMRKEVRLWNMSCLVLGCTQNNPS